MAWAAGSSSLASESFAPGVEPEELFAESDHLVEQLWVGGDWDADRARRLAELVREPLGERRRCGQAVDVCEEVLRLDLGAQGRRELVEEAARDVRALSLAGPGRAASRPSRRMTL